MGQFLTPVLYELVADNIEMPGLGEHEQAKLFYPIVMVRLQQDAMVHNPALVGNIDPAVHILIGIQQLVYGGVADGMGTRTPAVPRGCQHKLVQLLLFNQPHSVVAGPALVFRANLR